MMKYHVMQPVSIFADLILLTKFCGVWALKCQDVNEETFLLKSVYFCSVSTPVKYLDGDLAAGFALNYGQDVK